jgi:hypothetical protein
VISFKAGGRQLLVGGQVAVDEGGKRRRQGRHAGAD